MSEFSLPTSLQYKMCPIEDKSSSSTMVQIVIWLLQRKVLLQLHTYVYFMPTNKGLTVVSRNIFTVFTFSKIIE